MTEDGYITVAELSQKVGVSRRSIQLRIDSYTWRWKDKKTKEILVSSLPAQWQTRLVSGVLAKVGDTALTTLAPQAQLEGLKDSQRALSVLGKELSSKDRRNIMVVQMMRERPQGTTPAQWLASVAFRANISTATVRRIIADFEAGGVVGMASRETGVIRSFDRDATRFLKGFYLQVIRESGACFKEQAWEALQDRAKQEGWRIGGRSTAFRILATIPQILIDFAKGGNMSLDNYFFIPRDCKVLRPLQVVIGDQHIFDFWIADYETGRIRRPECYLWLDQGTKMIYGIAFAELHYSASTVKEALRNGVARLGAFENTYNDNGTSECSRAVDDMIADLQRMGMDMRDESELSRLRSGGYAIEDEDGNVIETARNVASFRRIFAQVKNAKAKDIERFFRTLEGRLTKRRLPGACATPGAPAAVDQVERARLEKQKDAHELLTYEQFVNVVCQELVCYENTVHQTLGMTPRAWLQKKKDEGWKPRQVDLDRLFLVTLERTTAKVLCGRVRVNNRYYRGARLTIGADGSFEDQSIFPLEGRRIEIRWARDDINWVIAMVPDSPWPARILTLEVANVMCDDLALQVAMKAKRQLMKTVRTAFKVMTKDVGDTRFHLPEEPVVIEEQWGMGVSVERALPEPEADGLPVPARRIFDYQFEHYEFIMQTMAAGHVELITDEDRTFMAAYEDSVEYLQNIARWESYHREIDARRKEA